jgi:hypothetical protein
MELTLEELQTIKDCLDITLTQLAEKSLLRDKIIKLLDKIEDKVE